MMEANDEELQACLSKVGIDYATFPITNWLVATEEIVKSHDRELVRQYAEKLDWDYISQSDWIADDSFLEEFEERFDWLKVVNNEYIAMACASVFWKRFEQRIPQSYDEIDSRLFDILAGNVKLI